MKPSPTPDAPIADAIREAYYADSYGLGDRRFKMRLLPKFSASFPVRENQVLFFNYGHSTVMPHPSFIYTGLDPTMPTEVPWIYRHPRT